MSLSVYGFVVHVIVGSRLTRVSLGFVGTIRHISPLPPLLPVAALDLEKTLIIPLLDQLLDLDLAQVSEEISRLSADLVSTLFFASFFS